MLRIEGVTTSYGAVKALDDVSFEVPQGSITAVLGANGAGKTTLLRTISGLVRPRAGSVVLDDRAIERLAPEAIARLGVAHVPEGRGVIEELTVEENLRLGGLWQRREARLRAASRRSPSAGTSPRARSPAASVRCWCSPAR